MKLKKIASLALAGIMAVSMLAGCSNGNSNSGNTEEPVAPSTGVSAKVQSLLKNDDLITLSDNATYSSYLDAALKKADFSAAELKAAAGKANAETAVKDVVDALKEMFSDNVVAYDETNSFKAAADVDLALDKDTTTAYLFALNGEMSEEVVLNTVVSNRLNNYVNDDELETKVTTQIGQDNYYVTGEYTGSVSMQKVTKDGTSTWFVLFVVNSDMTSTKLN